MDAVLDALAVGFFNKDLSTSSRVSFSMLRSISPEAYCIAMDRMMSAAWFSFFALRHVDLEDLLVLLLQNEQRDPV